MNNIFMKFMRCFVFTPECICYIKYNTPAGHQPDRSLLSIFYVIKRGRLHHATHAAHSWSAHWHFRFVFFLFYNYTFSSQEHTCY